MRHIREIKVDGVSYDVETDDKGVTFYKHSSSLPFMSILWQDVYSAAWKFTEIRTDYENKTSARQSAEDKPR